MIASIGITVSWMFVSNEVLQSILISIGCGGIASIGIAWLLSIRDYYRIKKENAYRFSLVMKGYLRLLKQLLFVAANECHGLYNDQDERSFKEWLELLCDKEKYSSKGFMTMGKRCKRLSGTIFQIQEYIEHFEGQSAVLILSGYPDIDKILNFFSRQRIYCWGTLRLVENNLYEDFCKTTYIIYREFLDDFPKYKKEFPDKYNLEQINELNLKN